MTERISAIPRQARPYQGQGAGLVTRSLAGAVDALTVVVALVVCYLGLNAAVFLVHPTGFQLRSASPTLSLATALVAAVGYLAATWSATGRSYGDHVMGLRVVGRDGQRIRVPRALARALFCVVFPVGLLWCAGSSARRSLQDSALGTTVIYDWAPRPEGLGSANSH